MLLGQLTTYKIKKIMNTKFIWLLLIFIGFTACNDIEYVSREETEIVPELTAGTVDFSTYVAIGASFTSGYRDGALFIAGQENSFPNILSKIFANVGGGTFTQPLTNDNIGGLILNSTVVANPRLYFDGSGPALLQATPTTDPSINLGAVFNNVGVPGAKSTHIDYNGYASLNPYFGRMATSTSISMLEYAIAQKPTFFTLSEIGGNDVLGYATTGGDDSNPITDIPTFNYVFNDMVTQLLATGAKGAITNVPYITDLAHFTTVPYNPIPLDAATAAYLNSAAAYGAYNAGIVQAFAYLVGINAISQTAANAEIAKRTITFTASTNNAVVIMDETLTDLTGINSALKSMRQATAEDLFVLSASSFIGTEAIAGNAQTINGVAIPLEDKWVLIPSEQAAIKTATDAYNATIVNVANSNPNIALVDLNSVLQELASAGIPFDGYTMNAKLVTGGAISLDGIHLSARGYALMANKFLEAIDAKFGSNFVASGNVAKAGDYPTTYSPELN